MTAWVREQTVWGSLHRMPGRTGAVHEVRVEGNMNDELIDVIIESVHDIFHGFLALEVFPGEKIGSTGQESSEILEERAVSQEIAIAIGLTGVLRGGITLGTSVPTSLNLAAALAGQSFDSLSGHALEVLGELADLIAGGVRTRLSSYGDVHLTPPMIVVGNQYTLNHGRIFSRVRQLFQVKGGHFFVECHYLKDFS